MDKKLNPFTYKDDPELSRIFDAMVDLKTRVAKQFSDAQMIAGIDADAKFHPVSDAKITLPNYRELRSPYNNGWGYNNKTPLEKVDRAVKSGVEEARKILEEVAALNKPIEDANTKLSQQITNLMVRLGIPSSYSTYEYPTSRSKTKRAVSHTAGYISDLGRAVPKSNVSAMKYTIDAYERDYANWVNQEKLQEQKEALEKDNAIVNAKILGNPDLVATLMQAGVNILEEVQRAIPGKKADVIGHCVALAVANITEKNKYLKLGYNLLQAFEDVSNAKMHAQNALNTFSVVSDQDVEIQNQISDFILKFGIVRSDIRPFSKNTDLHYRKVLDMANDTANADLLIKLSRME
jgi:hypothetical protein